MEKIAGLGGKKVFYNEIKVKMIIIKDGE